MRDHGAIELDGLGKGPSAFSGDEQNLARLFVSRNERPEKIRRNAAAPSANAGRGPGDRFAEDILPAENRSEARWQSKRQFHWQAELGGTIQFFQCQPDFCFHRAQNFWCEIKKRCDGQREDRQGEGRIVMDEREPTEHGDVFTETKRDVRKWFG